MKYILLNDIHSFFDSKIKYFIMYIVAISSFCILRFSMHIETDKIFKGIFSITLSNDDFLFQMAYVLNIAFFAFISFHLFTHDFKNSLDNIYLRIKSSNWIRCKLLSILFILFILTFIIFIIFIIIMFIYNNKLNILYMINHYFLYYFYIVFIQLLFLFIYMLFKYKKIYSLLFLVTFVLIDISIFKCFSLYFYSIYKYLLLSIIIALLIIRVYKYHYVCIFEGISKYES